MNIYKENDLDKFKFFPGNRPVDKCNLNKIKESIQTNNILSECPIVVNKDYEILDGQHRYQAAKELRIPIYYIVKENGSYQDIITLNENNKKWSQIDYLRLYSNGLKNEDYIKLEYFMKDNHLKLHQALIILNGPVKQMSEYEDFRKGKFKFPQDEEYISRLVSQVKEFWDILAEHGVKPLHRFKSTACLKPFLVFITTPGVNWEIFKQKLDAWWYKIGVRPSYNLYIDMFVDVYNYRNQNKIHIH